MSFDPDGDPEAYARQQTQLGGVVEETIERLLVGFQTDEYRQANLALLARLVALNEYQLNLRQNISIDPQVSQQPPSVGDDTDSTGSNGSGGSGSDSAETRYESLEPEAPATTQYNRVELNVQSSQIDIRRFAEPITVAFKDPTKNPNAALNYSTSEKPITAIPVTTEELYLRSEGSQKTYPTVDVWTGGGSG